MTLMSLAQYLVMCPGCGKPAAAHVNVRGPSVVRFVCPTGCPVDEAGVLQLVRAVAVADAQATLEAAAL